MRILGKIYRHAHKPECTEMGTTRIFIAWTAAQWLFSYSYKRIHFSMCSKQFLSDLCSSTFPNFVSQIVKIGYRHILYKDKRPHGGHDCAEKQGQQTKMPNLSLPFLKCDVTSCSYSKQPQSVVFLNFYFS